MATGLNKKILHAALRSVPAESYITLSLTLTGKLHRLQRPKDEILEKTLKRISLTVVKAEKKERKKRGEKETQTCPPPVVTLFDKEGKEEVAVDTPNVAAWIEGAWLTVDHSRYLVTVNAPVVQKLEVQTCIMAGCPIVPQVDIEFSDIKKCTWSWWRLPKPIDESLNSDFIGMSVLDPTYQIHSAEFTPKVHRSRIYWPTQEDVGKRLLIQCIPCNASGRYGNPAYVYSSIVLEEPKLSAINRRQCITPSYIETHDEIRVVSYNILADQYSNSDFAFQVLYPYCKQEALHMDYRQSLIVKELLGYHPDIVCLQEVATKCFETYLLPVMQEKGYDGHHAVKTGQMPEGEAIFFNLSKYECIQTSWVSLKESIQNDSGCQELFQSLQKAPTVLRNVTKKHTILQLTVLKCLGLSDHYILVANTHLCYHPTEDHVRLLQAITCIRAIHKALQDFKATLQPCAIEPQIAVVFCGDFNSCPCIGAYEFITRGFLAKTHMDWTKYKYSILPRCGCCEVPPNESDYIINNHPRRLSSCDGEEPEEKELEDGVIPKMFRVVSDDFNGLDIQHDFHLVDTCSPLPYTNYTVGFKAVLDYIFVDSDLLTVKNVVQLPSHEEVAEHTALPSICFPSDHLALVCELKWKK